MRWEEEKQMTLKEIHIDTVNGWNEWWKEWLIFYVNVYETSFIVSRYVEGAFVRFLFYFLFLSLRFLLI